MPLKVIVERENTRTHIPVIVEKIVEHLTKYGTYICAYLSTYYI